MNLMERMRMGTRTGNEATRGGNAPSERKENGRMTDGQTERRPIKIRTSVSRGQRRAGNHQPAWSMAEGIRQSGSRVGMTMR